MKATASSRSFTHFRRKPGWTQIQSGFLICVLNQAFPTGFTPADRGLCTTQSFSFLIHPNPLRKRGIFEAFYPSLTFQATKSH